MKLRRFVLGLLLGVIVLLPGSDPVSGAKKKSKKKGGTVLAEVANESHLSLDAVFL